jgi:carbonic anhydrase
MSTTGTNMNISSQNIYGKCDLKCAYAFNYETSNSTATNNGNSISITYDNSTTPPVLYNSQKYNVSNISIYNSSLHYYNGNKTDAELWIYHIPAMGGPNFIVCIPIVMGNSTTDATTFLTEIIANVTNYAPAKGETTNLNIADFSLQSIVPTGPYFSYTNSNLNSDVIIYGISSAIIITSSTLSTLKKLIKPYSLNISNYHLYFNSKGSNHSGEVGDGIYISCKPTGSSGDEIPVNYNKNAVNYDLDTILNSSVGLIILQILIGIILFVVVYIVLNMGFEKVHKYITINNKPRD